MTEITKNLNEFSHVRWVKRIGDMIGEDDTRNIIIFSLSYTLQSLKAGDNFNRFKWKD